MSLENSVESTLGNRIVFRVLCGFLLLSNIQPENTFTFALTVDSEFLFPHICRALKL
jgi:hypothetical protein